MAFVRWIASSSRSLFGVEWLSFWARDHEVRLCDRHWQWDEDMMSLRTLADADGSDFEKIILLSWFRNGVITDRRARHWDPEWTGVKHARRRCGICDHDAVCNPWGVTKCGLCQFHLDDLLLDFGGRSWMLHVTYDILTRYHLQRLGSTRARR